MSHTTLLYLYGSDEFAIARRLEEIQDRWDKDGMNTVRLDTRTASREELNRAVNAMPFLGEKRLVFIANPFYCSKEAKEREQFIAFLQNAPASTMVVIHEVVENRDIKKHWLVKRAEKGDLRSEACIQPRAWDMPGWIVKEAQRQKGAIEPAAATVLAEMVGEDTRSAAQEITKLLIHAGGGHPITVAEVQAVSIVSAQGNVFDLVDAMASGRGREAQAMLHRLLEDEDALALWGMVIRQFRLLLLAREVIEARGSVLDAQTSIHEAAYSIQKAYEQAKRYQMATLEKIYHRLLEMDEAAKTSQVPLDLALDTLIVELSQPGG